MEDLSNRKFGKLTVISFSGRYQNRWPIWLCQCECGNIKEIRAGSLKSGLSKSCGCIQGGVIEYKDFKKCKGCNKIKPLDDFGKRRDRKGRPNQRCKECVRKTSKEWRLKNPDKVKRLNHKYCSENKDQRAEYVLRWANNKWKTDPMYRLNSNMRNRVYLSLKGNKDNKTWKLLVGYSIRKLRAHLERQFKSGMTWENYGEWHIDHIIPMSVFNFTKPEHLDFKKCWDLNNLRPMWAKENISKGHKIKTPFQPSLKLELKNA